jgi:hypothetical protein
MIPYDLASELHFHRAALPPNGSCSRPFLGAVIAALIAVLFVMVPKPPPGLDRGWGLLVAPIFAGIAAVPGAMVGFVVGVLRTASRR